MTSAAVTPRRAAVAFIFATVVLDMLAFGIVIPVLPQLVNEFFGSDVTHAARVYGLFGTAWTMMQFLFSPLQGVLSDRFGRRPLILISCLGLGLDYLLMAWAPTWGWILLGRFLSGAACASFTISGAYLTDVTPLEGRARAFGIIGAGVGFGLVLGPALGGALGQFGTRLPFWVAGSLTLVNACYGSFILPESLPRERRNKFSWRRANPIGALAWLRSNTALLNYAAVSFLFQLANFVLPSAFVLYVSYRYGWSSNDIGASLALVSVCSIVVQAGLVGRIVQQLGERNTLLTGLVCGVIGFTCFGLARNGAELVMAMPLFALSGLIVPGLQALMARCVPPTDQGELQGANTCLTGVAGLIAPGLFTQIFAFFVKNGSHWQVPGAPFFLAALILVLALPLTLSANPAGRTGPCGDPQIS